MEDAAWDAGDTLRRWSGTKHDRHTRRKTPCRTSISHLMCSCNDTPPWQGSCTLSWDTGRDRPGEGRRAVPIPRGANPELYQQSTVVDASACLLRLPSELLGAPGMQGHRIILWNVQIHVCAQQPWEGTATILKAPVQMHPIPIGAHSGSTHAGRHLHTHSHSHPHTCTHNLASNPTHPQLPGRPRPQSMQCQSRPPGDGGRS